MESKSLESTIKRLLLDDPDGWEFGEFRAVHAASGVALWTANWVFFLDTEPVSGGVRWWRRPGLWRAYRKSRRLQMQNQIGRTVTP